MVIIMAIIKSSGIFRYSPQLLGEGCSVNWWLVIDADPGIGQLYRALYKLQAFNCDQLLRPAWAEHVSVIRNEEPLDHKKNLWKKYDGESIEFAYEPIVKDNGKHFWLPVQCERALDIRMELGLSRHPEYYLHLTIGNAPV